jgi:diguanylate cyclase (GGDEF)-like protein
MKWLILLAILLLASVALLFRRRLLRRRRAAAAAAASSESFASSGSFTSGSFSSAARSMEFPNDVADRPEPRVRQFLHTGSHRMPEPHSAATDLRHEAQTMLEEAEVASDLATLDAFLADVRDALGADEAVFWRWSEKRDALAPASWSTVGATRPKHFDMNAWGPLVKWAAEGRIMHFDADARVAVTRLAAAPIELDGRLIGVLTVARAEGLDRGREHLKSWLPRHATQVGRIVALFELRREYGRYMRQGQALLAAAQYVQGHKSQEALCKAICETALQVSSASDAALIRWRGDVSRGWVQYNTPGFRHRAPFPLTADSLTARACEEGTVLLIEDVSKMTGRPALFFEGDGGWPKGTLAVVPLKLEERVIGGIVVAADRAGSLPREESRNVALLGALAATSLEMVWEMEEVSRRARTDALTGLANRRAFDEQLEQLLAHADRFGHSVSLILADVDHFKTVNDTWGHETGDLVLKSIAGTLSEGVRAVDVCARFGGEEIAILLPQTSLLGASELADRLRKAVGARPIMAAGNEIPVTISCGVSCYPEGVLTKEALFAAADRALYEAKNSGRNRVKSAAPKPIGVVR